MLIGKGLGGGEQSCANSPTIKTLGSLEHVVGTAQAPVNTQKKDFWDITDCFQVVSVPCSRGTLFPLAPALFAKRGAALQRLLLPLLSREHLLRGEQLGGL